MGCSSASNGWLSGLLRKAGKDALRFEGIRPAGHHHGLPNGHGAARFFRGLAGNAPAKANHLGEEVQCESEDVASDRINEQADTPDGFNGSFSNQEGHYDGEEYPDNHVVS